MNERIEKIKNHLRENKITYFVGIGGVIVGGFGVWAISQKVEIDISQKAFLNWKSKIIQEQKININLLARGHRGNIVQCDQTGEKWPSQNLCSIANKIDSGVLSMHLNGKKEHVNNKTYTNLGENFNDRLVA